jgi:hypothetical protein
VASGYYASINLESAVAALIGTALNRLDRVERIGRNLGFVATPRIRYKKPPVVERALVVHAPVPEEIFQLKAEAWESIVKAEFPHARTLTEWTLAVRTKEGMPVLDPDEQTMTLRQTFWRGPQEKRDLGMQLWPQRISFNLLGEIGTNPRRYEELEELVDRWLPRWASHFEVSTCGGVTLEYVNILSEQTLPNFIDGARIRIGDAVTMFRMIPGNLRQIITPFDFQVTVEGETEPESRITSQCICPPVTFGQIPKIQLRFRATTHVNPNRISSVQNVHAEGRQMHQLIITQFEAYFTDQAKKTFDPYGDDSSAPSR